MKIITELKPNEVFVFGSNQLGNHDGGAAKFAVDNFGAWYGVGYGFQGNIHKSYAIPTLDDEMQRLPLHVIQNDLQLLVWIAEKMPTIMFLLTPIGQGIAGFSRKEIESVLPHLPPNIIKVGEWN